MTAEPKTGLVLGYDGVHPFSRVEISDRASVQELLRRLLDPLEPFFSPQKARVKCPGATAVRFDQTASEVEGICRPLWGLACLLAGGGDTGQLHQRGKRISHGLVRIGQPARRGSRPAAAGCTRAAGG